MAPIPVGFSFETTPGEGFPLNHFTGRVSFLKPTLRVGFTWSEDFISKTVPKEGFTLEEALTLNTILHLEIIAFKLSDDYHIDVFAKILCLHIFSFKLCANAYYLIPCLLDHLSIRYFK